MLWCTVRWCKYQVQLKEKNTPKPMRMLKYSNPAWSRVLPCLTLYPCLLRLEFADELDEGTATVLVGVLGSEIGDLILCIYKVDGDLSLLH